MGTEMLDDLHGNRSGRERNCKSSDGHTLSPLRRSGVANCNPHACIKT